VRFVGVCGFGVLGNLRSWRFGKEDSLFSRTISVRDFLFFIFSSWIRLGV
jgi:hypothetical protein